MAKQTRMKFDVQPETPAGYQAGVNVIFGVCRDLSGFKFLSTGQFSNQLFRVMDEDR